MKFKRKGENFLQDVPDPNSWDFVWLFFHGYSSSDTIALSNDLHCFINGECTRKEFMERHDVCPSSGKKAKEILETIDAEIYTDAYIHFINDVLNGEIVLTN